MSEAEDVEKEIAAAMAKVQVVLAREAQQFRADYEKMKRAVEQLKRSGGA
jgi:hypothetical protein